MKLFSKQENAVYFLKDNCTEEIIYGGAAGGGKSALGCLWLIECCQQYPGTRWLMGRSKLKTLKETTLHTFFELVTQLGIKSQFKYNAQEGIIHWYNGSQIILKDLFAYPSDPNFDSLGSLEITGAFIDECSQITEKAWQITKSRIRYKLHQFQLIPKMLGSCNPVKNWVYKSFYKPFKDNALKKHRRFIQALPSDNPHLHPSYLQALLRLDKNSKERLYYGNWEYDDDPATLIHHDAIANYFNPVHVPAQGQKYLTIDVARKGKDNTVFRVWHGWLCIARKALPISSVPQVVALGKSLQVDYKIPAANVIADEDGVGGGVVDYLRCKGFINNATPLEITEAGRRVKPNFDNLKSQCSIKMAEVITKGMAGELCNDSEVARITAEEMEQVKLKNIDSDGKQGVVPKDVVKEKLGRSPDEWDSIMMRYWFELKPVYSTRVRVG